MLTHPVSPAAIISAVLAALCVPSALAGDSHEWRTIGEYGCYGLPDAHRDPNDSDNYLITWQRYAERRRRGTRQRTSSSRFTTPRRSSSAPSVTCSIPSEMTIYQGHPCWGYSQGEYRVFYCQKSARGDYIAQVSADEWLDFRSYVVSNNEPVITPDLGARPHLAFLPEVETIPRHGSSTRGTRSRTGSTTFPSTRIAVGKRCLGPFPRARSLAAAPNRWAAR